MKKSLTILIIILIAWYGLSTYWYVCRIRSLCENPNQLGMVSTVIRILNSIAPPTDNSRNQVIANRVLYFDADSIALNARYNTYLTQAADYMRQHPRTYVRLIGYAAYSSDYADDSHVLFSRSRAQAVADHLIGHGASADHITIDGRGYKEAPGDNNTDQGRSQNRRVEVIFYHY